MSIEGEGHFLALAQGCVHSKNMVYIYMYLNLFALPEHLPMLANSHNKFLTAKLLKLGYWYYKLRNLPQHFELIKKYHVSLNSMEIWYIKLKKIIGNPNFSDLFKSIHNHLKKAGYNLDIMQLTECLVFNPTLIESYAVLFSCTL